MPRDLEGRATVADCVAAGVCGCICGYDLKRRAAVERELLERGLVLELQGRNLVEGTLDEVLDAVMSVLRDAGEQT